MLELWLWRGALVAHVLLGTTAAVRTGGSLRLDTHQSGCRWQPPVPGDVKRNTTYGYIAVNADYSNLWEQIITFPERRPRLFNVMLATFKTWSADAVVQFVERRWSPLVQRGRGIEVGQADWKFDWRRSGAFATFGFLYVGLVQWFLYVSLLTKVFPDAIVFSNLPLAEKVKDTSGQFNLLGQVLLDNFVVNCFIYFPIFYITKEIIQGAEGTWLRTVPIALHRYWKSITMDNSMSWCVWIPADCIVFSVPMYMRMPLDHSVSFVFTMIVSAMRGAPEHADDSRDTLEK